MSLPVLTVIPAGAGSGKTHTIQTRLGEWIKDGKIQPERIVAVTFTEAAAGELRERIREELIRTGRPEDALKLDQAIITTIHGFGLRVLSEFCFEAGITPRPRLLSEDEEGALIRHALTGTERADAVMDQLKAFGYPFTTAQINAITETMRGFEAWMKKALGVSEIGREVPLLALDNNGSVVSGAVDVLASTSQGYWIIDYKSDETKDKARFRMYMPQLLAYAEALRKNMDSNLVCGIAIFWINSGEIYQLSLQN